MRTIEITVFDYNELSDSAKVTALENWRDARQSEGYLWSHEIRNIVNWIEKKTGVCAAYIHYDTSDYGYDLKIDGRSDNSNKYKKTGLRAAKIALAMYYSITGADERLYYTKRVNGSGKAYFDYLDKRHLSIASKHRLSSFNKHDECFTGYCESVTFSKALWDSIKKNTSKDYTVFDHFEEAFNALFSAVVADYEHLESESYFIENEAPNYEYLEDGEVATAA